ncbi:MAG: Holliday junction branch migration protein RuvA [Bacteroidales bacterium]|nr:Holliday junction branch migration protein RuvA [Bacteroidales bacterium]
MYEFISGKITDKSPTHVIIENGGIGYLIHITLNTFTKIKDQESVRLFVHFIVREDAHLLYGFADDDERILFRALISVSGVGANTARLVLSSLSSEEAYDAIASGNAGRLQSVKGIGAKTAQRIVVDLKDKVVKEGIKSDNLAVSHNTIKDEALSGLLILGFNRLAASRVLDKILKEKTPASVEELIKEALKVM